MKRVLSNKPKIIAVVGPTASGKTTYSIKLAKEIGGEVVSADSRLVYKDMNIGTAKPTLEEMSGIKHYMIDLVTPDFNYSAGLYCKQAKECIYDIISRDKVPIIAGGTGLYIDILLKGFDLPEFEPDYELRKKLSLLNSQDLYEKLLQKDPDATSRIDKNDKKKIIRAIEIIEITGNKLSEARGYKDIEFDIKWIGLNYKRNELYDRINKRVDLMLENGLIDETKMLINKYGRVPNIIDTIGYKEILGYIDGIYSPDEAVELLKRNTRRYAKRQLTWFRKNDEIEWNIYPDKLPK